MIPAALLLQAPLAHAATAAGADSAAVAAESLIRAIEGWHEFYLLAGTAAVTLVGLLFVALSFHLDTLLHDQRSHLLAAARMAFMNFVFVLVLSLFFLMPNAPPRVIGIGALALSSMTLGYVLWNAIRARRKGPLSDHEQFLRRRFAIGGLVLGIALAASIGFVIEPHRSSLMQFMALTIVVLVNAAGMSWDLLVQVGRMRKTAGETPKA